jgi:hypothetical protein
MSRTTNGRKESDVATAQKKGGKKPSPKASAKPKSSGSTRGRNVETPAKASFGVDDKRAQYARLVVFNYAKKQKIASAGHDVNSAPQSVIEKAGKELAGGTLLHGPDGLELITSLSKAGATDEKVAKRGLTAAYAAEVRPFIRRLQFSDGFGRRNKAPAKPKAEKVKKEKPAEAPAETPETPTEE